MRKNAENRFSDTKNESLVNAVRQFEKAAPVSYDKRAQ